MTKLEQWLDLITTEKRRIVRLIDAAQYSCLPPTTIVNALRCAFHRLIIANRAMKSAQINPKLP